MEEALQFLHNQPVAQNMVMFSVGDSAPFSSLYVTTRHGLSGRDNQRIEKLSLP